MSLLAAFLTLCGLIPAQARVIRVPAAASFVRPLEFKHQLRVCNAYPYTAALDVFRGRHEKLTDKALPYKACEDFTPPLQSGDKLEFKVGDASAGTFAVDDLPDNDAVLLLVIHRHDAHSTAVAFESHIFANLQNAQVAVIDTFKGKARGVPRIMDVKSVAGKSSRSEELRYDSVVAINPGVYNVELDGQDGKAVTKSEFAALAHQSYVIIRTGVESDTGPSYPQELFVFPQSDASELRSAAASVKLLYLTSALVIACVGW